MSYGNLLTSQCWLLRFVCFWFANIPCYSFKAIMPANNASLDIYCPVCTSVLPCPAYLLHAYPHNPLIPKMRNPGKFFSIRWVVVKCLHMTRSADAIALANSKLIIRAGQMLTRRAVFSDLFPTNNGRKREACLQQIKHTFNCLNRQPKHVFLWTWVGTLKMAHNWLDIVGLWRAHKSMQCVHMFILSFFSMINW